MARQEVAFLKECRKIKGCESLREDFYTKFKPENKGYRAVTWWIKIEESKALSVFGQYIYYRGKDIK